MQYIKGNFVDTDGIEHQELFFLLDDEKRIEFYQAAQISKKQFLVLCSDTNGLIRVASVSPSIYRKLPDNQSGQGHYFNSLRQENGMPMSTFDLVYRLPKSVTDAEIIKIAKLHLAGNEGSEIGHTIK